MSEAAPLLDILPTVLSRYEELGNTPHARRLADVRIGPTNLWDAVRYDVADVIYDESYQEVYSAGKVDRPFTAARGAITRNLWQAQLGEEFLVGLLSARLGFLGDLLERGSFHVHGLRSRRGPGRRADILVAGSMYRSAVAALGPVLHRLGSHYGLEYLVVAHDDALQRHGRAFRRSRIRWRDAAAFSSSAHRAAASEVVDRARIALQDAGASKRSLPAPVLRKALSERHVRRLAWNFLAAQNALSTYDPSVVVIPDERQPLARLVGLEARSRGLSVVSAPFARDQIFRKTPLWTPIVSTRMFVFSPLASRFLGRAGAPPRLFECVSGIPLQGNSSAELGAHGRVVLFASQGQALNAALLPMVTDCVGGIPDAALVIRPHPYERLSMVRLMNPRARVSGALTARQAIEAADVLVTHSSFMAVEAALLGRPVILVSPDAVPSLMPLITEGLARWVRTSEELRRTLEEILAHGDSRLRPAQQHFRSEQAAVPGLERATDVLAELARS